MTARLIGRTGELRGTDAPVSESLTIGSGPDSGIRIRSRTVSRRHAQVVKSGTEYYVEDLGSRNGTFLNGQRVQRFPVRHLDVLSIGPEADLIFIESGSAAAVPSPPVKVRGTIQWLDGPLEGKSQEFAAGRSLILGRSVDLPLDGISLRHAAITIADAGAVVEDLRSTNGTFVNRKLISQPTVLSDGDEVSLAKIASFRVSLVRGTSQETADFADTGASETIMVTRQPADQKVLAVPPSALSPTPASSAEHPPAAAAAPPPAAPEPVPPPVLPPPSETPRPGDGTVAAPRAAAVAPAFNEPGPAAEARTMRPPREAAGGLPASIAERARAARDATDATFAVPPSAPPPTAPPAAAEVPPAPAHVAPGAGKVTGARFDGPQDITLNRGTFLVGRHADCEIRLDLRDVGRRHARVTVSESGVTVEDLGSANGTFVNGAQISTPSAVPDGSTLRFAAIQFTVSYLRAKDDGDE